MKSLTILLSSCALLFACNVGEPTDGSEGAEVEYLDTDGDGVYDAVDSNLDGIPDYVFEIDEGQQELVTQAFCLNPLVDSDGDGAVDGLDWNCDGIIDVPLRRPPATGGTGGGGGGGSSSSSCNVTVNDKNISCESVDGGDYDCTCSIGGQVVSSCTTSSNSACSVPGNCCGF